MTQKRDMLIIGGGPGGLTAALYAARMGLQAVLLEAGIAGGQMLKAWLLENYPSYQSILGGDLAAKMKEQAEKAGAEIRELTRVEKLDLTEMDKVAITAEGEEYHAPVVILAMGAHHAKLGVPGEAKLEGRGVSYCATCDGPLFRGRTTLVVGGGNTAAMEALFLANIVEKVYVTHRRDKLRAEQTYADRLKQHPKVEILWDTIVTEVLGKEVVSGVKIHNKRTGREWTQAVHGVFIAIGVHPNSAIAISAGVKADERDRIIVDQRQRTNIPNVYAVGDLTSNSVRQIVTACGDAVVAVSDWLSARLL